MRKNKIAVILFILMTALNGAVFLLYDIMTEAFFTLICSLFIRSLKRLRA